MRLSPPNYRTIGQSTALDITYGGGEANVSIGLASLGMRARHVSKFPDTATGRAAELFLRGSGISTEGTATGGARLGLYFLEMGAAARPSKVTYDRAGSAFALCDPADFDWEKILEGTTWFHWTGITPAISQGATEALLEALQVCKAKGITVSADINYRKNLWKYGKTVKEVLPELISYTDIAIASKNDMKEVLEASVSLENDKFLPVAQLFMQQYQGVKLIVNTKRESVSANHNYLSGIAFNGSEVFETKKMEIVPIVDRIGGGDAFAAGFIYGMAQTFTIEKALQYGVAYSVLKHSVPGDANLATLADLEMVANGDTSGRLVR